MNLITTTSFRTMRTFHTLLSRSIAYKSAIALDHLYPQSTLKLTTPVKPDQSATEKFSGYIPMDQLTVTYSRSTGPGGQNVNKVNTKVDLRFHLASATWIHEDIKSKLQEKFKTKLTKEGFLVFKSDLTRSQQLNLADCLNKIRESILAATYLAPPPSEETVEKIRKRHEAAVRERLMTKKHRSQVKSDRQGPNINDM